MQNGLASGLRRAGSVWPLTATQRSTLAAGALWALVGLAALGGGWAALRPDRPAAVVEQSGVDTEALVGSSWEVAGFAQAFVDAYLTAGDGAALEPYLGYEPELQPRPQQTGDPTGPSGALRAVDVDEIAPGYWAVTVVAPGAAGEEARWRVGVSTRRSGRPLASSR
jgi:hypothetical protein